MVSDRGTCVQYVSTDLRRKLSYVAQYEHNSGVEDLLYNLAKTKKKRNNNSWTCAYTASQPTRPHKRVCLRGNQHGLCLDLWLSNDYAFVLLVGLWGSSAPLRISSHPIHHHASILTCSLPSHQPVIDLIVTYVSAHTHTHIHEICSRRRCVVF